MTGKVSGKDTIASKRNLAKEGLTCISPSSVLVSETWDKWNCRGCNSIESEQHFEGFPRRKFLNC